MAFLPMACGLVESRDRSETTGGDDMDLRQSGGAQTTTMPVDRCPAFDDLLACAEIHVESETREVEEPCEIRFPERYPTYDLVVTVDCEVVPYQAMGGAGGSAGGWILDTETSPPTLRLWGDVCEQVQDGFERIDISIGCPRGD
jgi:hypothetical protein